MKNPLYIVWYHMIARCHNPERKDYARYGGRGIKVCDRWRNSFEDFLEDMGERPEGLTLERKDNNKGYHPDNCKWATYKEQGNNRNNNTYVKYKGEEITVSNLAERCNIHPATLWQRIFRQKNTPEEAVRRKIRPIKVRNIKYNGENKSLSEWAEKYNIKYSTLHYRLFITKWPIEKSLGLCV